MSNFLITGAKGGTHNRLEINDFVKNEKFFSLYIQALHAMYQDDENNVESYFQIAGIHGLPYVPWDNATSDEGWNSRSGAWGGYCIHGSVLFPMWHRPYISLFEQVLQKQAVRIAATYKVDKIAWERAALEIRQPYWDWAAKSVPPNEILSPAQVEITDPDGRVVYIDNPLYNYEFRASFADSFNLPSTTVRKSDIQSAFQNSQYDITSSTIHMLMDVDDWFAFSNKKSGNAGTLSNSVEAIHDGIHVALGGSMASSEAAAFDPIFWLHHCNADRLLSLWSALHPNVGVSADRQDNGSFTISQNAKIHEDTPLTPFWNGQTTFWNSTLLGDTTKLGYTYPEFNGLSTSDPRSIQDAIWHKAVDLYGWAYSPSSSRFLPSNVVSAAIQASTTTPTNNLDKEEHFVSSFMTDSNVDHHIPSGEHTHHTIPAHSEDPSDLDLFDWTARIECEKYELGRSFSVLLFLGEVPEASEEWQLCSSFVGAYHVFVNSVAERCANCSSQVEFVAEGFVHLDHKILQHSGLHSLEPDVVEPYLTQALQWRVQTPDGKPASLKSLEVSVYVIPLSYPNGATSPVHGEPRLCYGITYGRDGGSRDSGV